MKLIEFELEMGVKVYINPEYVMAVGEYNENPEYTVIDMNGFKDDETYIVKGKVEEVRKKLMIDCV